MALFPFKLLALRRQGMLDVPISGNPRFTFSSLISPEIAFFGMPGTPLLFCRQTFMSYEIDRPKPKKKVPYFFVAVFLRFGY